MLYIVVPLAVLIGVIWALVVFPSFRVVAVILAVLGTVAYYTMSEKAEKERKQQEAVKEREDQQARIKFEADQKAYCQAEQKRWTIVPASQIEIRNPSLTPEQFYGSISNDFTFAASAKNKSKYKVTALRLNVTALDCPTQDAKATDCDIVGRSVGIFDANIPAGEVRQINGKFTMPGVPKSNGVFSPRFAVNGVRAPIDQADDTPANDVLGGWLYRCN
jgi:Tfp pilus assembly protein PilE